MLARPLILLLALTLLLGSAGALAPAGAQDGQAGYDVALIFDRTTFDRQVRASALDLISRLDANRDQIAIFTAGRNASRLQGLTDDFVAAANALELVQSDTSVRAAPALSQARAELQGRRRRPENYPAVVLWTGGRFLDVQATLNAVEALTEDGIQVFFIGAGPSPDLALLMRLAPTDRSLFPSGSPFEIMQLAEQLVVPTPTPTPRPITTPTLTPLPTPTPPPTVPPSPSPVPSHRRFFAESGFSLADPAFIDYFDRRGGLRTFGYPISRSHQLLGRRSQIFQHAIMQLDEGGRVSLANLMTPEFMPFTRFAGATIPAWDPAFAAAAPRPGEEDWGRLALEFISARVPQRWRGIPVGFYTAYLNTVRAAEAFPEGDVDTSLLPLFNVEIWGLPVSAPGQDPNRRGVVYQRFERGVMAYDASCACVRALPMAAYFKSLLTGEDLPSDLESQARFSRFYRQYDNLRPRGLVRPEELPDTNLRDAFEPEAP